MHANTVLFFNIDTALSSSTCLGLSRSLTNLINGESLLTSVLSLVIYSGVVHIRFKSKSVNHTLGKGFSLTS